MYFRRKTSAGRAYLQIVESRRDGDQVRQQVIATLGRFDELQASGQLERLVRSGARFAAKAMVLSAASNNAAIKIAVRRIGPALVFERLWEETGCRAVPGPAWARQSRVARRSGFRRGQALCAGWSVACHLQRGTHKHDRERTKALGQSLVHPGLVPAVGDSPHFFQQAVVPHLRSCGSGRADNTRGQDRYSHSR